MNPETAKRYHSDWSKISEWIRMIRGYRCEECFTRAVLRNPLTVHHIDGRPENNDKENLIVLCAKCHLRLQQTGRTLNCWTKAYQTTMF